jgi:hydrogenase nickel incorporation protein HypA/HybF
MHELSIAQNILETVTDYLKDTKYNKVTGIKIKVGELAAVDARSLKFSFEVITKDTEFDGVPLIIEEVPLIAYCNSCKSETKIESFFFLCKNCDSTDINVTQGEELNLSEIEFE